MQRKCGTVLVSWLLLMAASKTCGGLVMKDKDRDLENDAQGGDDTEVMNAVDANDATVGGDLFGLLGRWRSAVNVCEKVSNTTFVTQRLGLLGTLLRTLREPARYTRGPCRQLCAALCACFSEKYERQQLGRKCLCKGKGTVCGKNAECNAQKQCQCRQGFVGDGTTCCGNSLIESILCQGIQVPSPSRSPTILRQPTPDPFFVPTPDPFFFPTPRNPAFPTPVRQPFMQTPSFRNDTTKPLLVAVIARTPLSIETSNPIQRGQFNVTLIIRDDESGCCNRLWVTATGTRSLPITGSRKVDALILGQSEHNVTLEWPVWTFYGNTDYNETFALSIEIADGRGNFAMFNTSELARLGFPSKLDVYNARDTTAPRLLNLVALTPSTIDVSTGTGRVELQAVVQDDQTDVLYGRLELEMPETGPAGAITFPPEKNSRSPVTLNFTIEFKDLPLRNYTFVGGLTLTLVDSYSNTIQISRSDLASRSLLSSLEFVSTPKLPEILNFTIAATKINEIRTLETTIVVQRGAFAVARGSILFTNGQASYSSFFAPPPNNPQSALNISQYTASTKVSPSDASQTFQVQVVLSDDFNNARSFSSNELSASGFPGSVKVPA